VLLPTVPIYAQATGATQTPAVGANAPAELPVNHVTGYTAWDDDYLYLGRTGQ